MSVYPSPLSGSERAGDLFSGGSAEGVNEGKEITLLEIQRGIIQQACEFVADVNPANPFSMVFTGGDHGRIARAAVLRSLGLVDIPENARYLQGQRSSQDQLIRHMIGNYSSNSSFQEGVRASKNILGSLEPFLTGSKELRPINQSGGIRLGNFWFNAVDIKDQLEKEPTLLSFIQTFSLRGLNSDQHQRGISLIAEMFTAAHTYFTDMEIENIVRVRRYGAYYTNRGFLEHIDGLLTKLTPPPLDLKLD